MPVRAKIVTRAFPCSLWVARIKALVPVRAKIVSGQVWKETAVAALYFLGQGTGNPSAIKTGGV